MRKWSTASLIAATSAACLIVGLMLAGTPASGQGPAGYRAPRSPYADGKPDLSGIWEALNSAHWNLEDHTMGPPALWAMGAIGAIPPGQSVVDGDGTIPYQPWGLAKRKEHWTKRMMADPYDREWGDPELKCYLPGIPRATYMPYPFQILQTPRYVLFSYEFANSNRVARMDSKTEGPVPTWMGWSNGHWEGETLVIEVADFIGQTWLDRAANFTTDTLKVTERYTRTGPDHLRYEATIEDPKLYTRPWKITMPLYRRVEKNAQLLEFRCVEFSEEALYGKLTKEGQKPMKLPHEEGYKQ